MKYGLLPIHGRLSGIVSLIFLLVAFFAASSRAQTGTIGIYSNPDRSSCSLSDNTQDGFVRAYVVANSQAGMTLARFAAPKPGCFFATWINDEIPQGFISIGNSQNDLAVAFGECIQGPVLVATMVFQKVATTQPCCEMTLVSPAGSTLSYTDCSFAEYPLLSLSGYVNGDASCACPDIGDLPPTTPSSPAPENLATNRPVLQTLSWTSNDPEAQPLHFDVYFGTTNDPPLVGDDVTSPFFDPGPLEYQTTYYWRVGAMDPANHRSDGPVWSFTTGVAGLPPPPAINPYPEDSATDILRSGLVLTWFNDVGGGPIAGYDVYFGTTTTPPKLNVSVIPEQSFPVGNLLLDTTYYWYVVTRGTGTLETTGPLWSFHTVTTNPPPSIPSNPIPPHNSQIDGGSTILRWTVTDPEGQPLTHDVYFGTNPDPPFVVNQTTRFYNVSSLTPGVDYYWRIVSTDPDSSSTSGPIWKFRANSNLPPTVPQLVGPPNGGSVPRAGVQLAWTATDPDSQALAYQVYFGTPSTPPFYTGTTATQVNLATLAYSTTYYWRIVAIEMGGLETSGPVWSFTTLPSGPPVAPSNPTPADDAINISRKPTLTWTASDPDPGTTLTYQIYFGTTSPPPLTGNSVTSPSYQPTGASPFTVLLPGTTYYWKIVAKDEGNSTPGPEWSFTTNASDLPPSAPAVPSPNNGAVNQPTSLMLQWAASDPEGYGLRYDVYFGTIPTPPMISQNINTASRAVTCVPNTDHYWRIVARDVDGNETSGPTWVFRTELSQSGINLGLYADEQGNSCTLDDVGQTMRNIYVVLDGPANYTLARFKAPKPPCWAASWIGDSSPFPMIGNSQDDVAVAFGSCFSTPFTLLTISYMSQGATNGCCEFPLVASPNVGYLEVVDCAFASRAAVNNPTLRISSNGGCVPCGTDGSLSFALVEDTCQTEVPEPSQTTYDLLLNPATLTDNGGVTVTFSPELTFVSCERGLLTQSWTTFEFNVTGNTCTITGVANAGYDPTSSGVFARLTFESNCCDWDSPATLTLSNPTGDFSPLRMIDRELVCRYEPDGDVNNDGNLTVADAQCALDVYLYAPLDPPSGCAGPSAEFRADVDCSNSATPADAWCIFRQWLDQSCSFCNGTAIRAEASNAVNMLMRVVREDRDVVVVLQERGLREVGAFGFELKYPPGLEFVRVESSRSDAFAALQARPVDKGRLRIGAYANGAPVALPDGDMLAVRFRASGAALSGTITANKFVDDLAGASEVTVSLDGATSVPSANQIVLHQNTPNPFNPTTQIRFELPDAMRVRLRIFDVHGRLVRALLDERREAGASVVEWNGTDERGATAATGIYFYVLDAGGKRYQHKMVMLK